MWFQQAVGNAARRRTLNGMDWAGIGLVAAILVVVSVGMIVVTRVGVNIDRRTRRQRRIRRAKGEYEPPEPPEARRYW